MFVGLKSKTHSFIKDVALVIRLLNKLTKILSKKWSMKSAKMFCLVRHKMKRIQTKNHKIGKYKINKIFSCFDEKRYTLNSGIKHFHIVTVKPFIELKQIKNTTFHFFQTAKIVLNSWTSQDSYFDFFFQTEIINFRFRSNQDGYLVF